MSIADELENDAALISDTLFGIRLLSDRERDFLVDTRALIARGGHLSPRQRAWLNDLHARRNLPEMRRRR